MYRVMSGIDKWTFCVMLPQYCLCSTKTPFYYQRALRGERGGGGSKRIFRPVKSPALNSRTRALSVLVFKILRYKETSSVGTGGVCFFTWIQLSLCLIRHHAITWMWVVSFTPRPLYLPLERAHGIHWIGGWEDLDTVELRKISCLFREWNPGRPAPRYTDWAIPARRHHVTLF
jgi:hypothetical protein